MLSAVAMEARYWIACARVAEGGSSNANSVLATESGLGICLVTMNCEASAITPDVLSFVG